MKSLKLNTLEKSEMNEARGGAPVCDGACYVCTAPIQNEEKGGAYGKKQDDKSRKYNWTTGFKWNGNVQPPKQV